MADTRKMPSKTLFWFVGLAILATVFIGPLRVSVAQESVPLANVVGGEATADGGQIDSKSTSAEPSQTEGSTEAKAAAGEKPEEVSLTFNERLLKGGALAITGMVIVFSGLLAITMFITVLPGVLDFVEQFLPESAHHHGHAPAVKPSAPVNAGEEEAIVAGIAFAIHSRNRQ
ncbi:MAG: Na+-transporting methylmalonyl-CoA/oxaloacetate decarboxylase gamma subunit [Pirellulaceae bacterium]|jgi:Na+-transporting methylmalonyl-CoA/oxaloacetate decarboxylase gamma subunit